MKQRISTLLILLTISTVAASLDAADYPASATVTIRIEKVRNINQGKLIVFAYRKVDRIGIEPAKAFKILSVVPEKGSATLVFENIPYGEYAWAAFHDLDGNGELKTNFLGIPAEDVAVSNGAKGSPFGAPRWEDGRVSINQPVMEFKLVLVALAK